MRRQTLFLFIALMSLCLLTSPLTGCRNGGKASPSADSTMIKTIEEMQKRGSTYRNHGDFQSAIKTHDSCIEMSKSIADTIQLVIALNNQGTNFRRLGALKEASDYHYHAREICDLYSDTVSYISKKNKARSLNGLGNILMSLKSSAAAVEVFHKALEVEKSLGSHTGCAINLANIGSIKNDEGQLDSARYYYNKSLSENLADSNNVGISLCYTYLGKLDEREGRKAAALANYHQAFVIGRTTNDAWHWLTPCISLAELYISNHQTDSAAYYVNTGMEVATKMNSSEHLSQLYAIRSQLYEQTGKINAALSDLRLSRIYNDSTINNESQLHVQNLRVNYEINRRTQEVRQAEEKAEYNALVRNVVIVASAIVIALLAVLLRMVYRYYRLHAKTMKDREILYRNITHQLRTPLTVVLGMIEQLKEHISASDKEGQQSIEAAHRQSQNLLKLVQELIKASKEGVVISDIEDTHPQIKESLATEGEIKGNDATDKLTADRLSAVLASEVQKEKGSTYYDNDNKALSLECEWDENDILVVEDNNDVAMLICTMLKKYGYNVRRAADGVEALEIMENDLPDLVITDIAMPRMDGLQLMRTIRADESMCHLPIIVVSARVEDNERLEGISSGAEVYLAKPFVSEELLLRVNKLLEQRNILRKHFNTMASSDNVADVVPGLSDEESEFISSLNNCVEKNMLESDLSSNLIAEKLFMSVSTLNRRTKNITGMSVAAYVRTRRILKAKHLLLSTTKPVSEVETLCGFNTQGYFSRLFKAKVGMTPSEYRTNGTESN